MSTPINLSSTLTNQLQDQATQLGMPLNELAEKLISQSLTQLAFSKQLCQEAQEQTEPSPTKSVLRENGASSDIDIRLTMAEIVARIRSRPRDTGSVHPATGTLDDVLAAFEANPPATPALTPEEWEAEWWPIRKEMRERDQMKKEHLNIISEG